MQARTAVDEAAQQLQALPSVVATQAALAEGSGDVRGALQLIAAALQSKGVSPGASKFTIARGQAAGVHWLLQRQAGLQLQVCIQN